MNQETENIDGTFKDIFPVSHPMQSSELKRLKLGTVIPAHPLALDIDRRLDERHQRGLTRYYLAAGAGGLAVGVHTTQFAIRDSQHNLLAPVLRIAMETAQEFSRSENLPRPVMIAGICGSTSQALREADLAKQLGYHAGLLSLGALSQASELELLGHCRSVGECLPLVGFYLQPAVGGRTLSYSFWRDFCEIPSVVAIKLAPFSRYQTLDVVRALAESSRWNEISLYTGNDDAIVTDLVSTYEFSIGDETRRLQFRGGLLGHWACWTRAAVQTFNHCRNLRNGLIASADLRELQVLANQVTDMNQAIFDAANGFRGCIAGVHEVLKRQGLLQGTWCLDSREQLSPGQADEISRVCTAYPHLTDDAFVRNHLADWIR